MTFLLSDVFMKIVGITGGSSLFELGPAIDVQLFFDCIGTYVEKKHPERDWKFLTDRLYRRYLRLEQLEMASELMAQVKRVFAGLSGDAINCQSRAANTRLDMENKTLSGVFEKYFESYAHCVESAKINYESLKSYPGYKYEPVRLVLADQPWFLIEKKRPLEDYDALEGSPFWLR
jgi:hypothetical protein